MLLLAFVLNRNPTKIWLQEEPMEAYAFARIVHVLGVVLWI